MSRTQIGDLGDAVRRPGTTGTAAIFSEAESDRGDRDLADAVCGMHEGNGAESDFAISADAVRLLREL